MIYLVFICYFFSFIYLFLRAKECGCIRLEAFIWNRLI